MGTKQTRKQSVLDVARRLDNLAELSDILELRLPNGADVGNMLYQIADDIREVLKRETK